MRLDRIANCALAGVAIAVLGASTAAAATAQYCWKSNGKRICVDSTTKPADCKVKPCVVTTSNSSGGNNKPVLEKPANAAAVAAKDDISVGLNLNTFHAVSQNAAVKGVAAPKVAAPTAAQSPH